ncbi:glycoside hydrolase family 65 protein [Alkalicoccus luteus]|uniref:Glycoside hydrolase family 65 protein n=1 Tax=Alkalicoccus luteus TaxID=1237094 RepID=A0A969TUC0_9BACI|nr:glycoside hydrolase family 65 protein [Alkalicoccus luteus]NJP36907.1 glycoside hydrolase family 65 protein [Alkalicoccus luteus]
MSWQLVNNDRREEQLLVNESLFALGNGFLGIRGNFEEGYVHSNKSVRGTYINAFHDITDITYGEKLYAFPETQQKLLNVIDSQTILISINGRRVAAGEEVQMERTLDMARGQSVRKLSWTDQEAGQTIVTFRRLVSFTMKELFAQQVEIETEREASVQISTVVNGDVSNFSDPDDPRVASGHAKRLTVEQTDAGDMLSVTCRTYESNLSVHCSAKSALSTAAERKVSTEAGRAKETYTFTSSGKTVLTRWSVYTDTYRHGEQLTNQAAQLLQACTSFEETAEAQEAYLQQFWSDSLLEIDGDPDLQQGIRFNLFHLLQSAGRDAVSNIPAKGLSGEGYEGHYFWDTEIYMFPFFLMTRPDTARQLLKYRFSLLEAAKIRAKEVGHTKGALFPWRTISGGECSAFFPAGTAQYHISADIAYSFIQYYLVTEEQAFLTDYLTELLTETARLWMDTGHMKDGQFRIDDVTGPDEYTCIVNNNFYTNAMAQYNLNWAAACWELLEEKDAEALRGRLQLEEGEAASWKKAAEHMYLPYDEKLRIHAQDDTFLQKKVWDLASTPKEKFPLLLNYHPLTLYRYQVCKQADTVLAHFLLEDTADEETMKRSYDYYEKVTTHDSSLSYCVFSMMAARHGDVEKAYRYFIETARLDIDNTHQNTKDGLHLANMGGTWLALVYGFAGMRIKASGLLFRPVLPKAWKSMSFRIRWRNALLEVRLDKDKVRYEALDGTLTFRHHEDTISLKEGEFKEIPLHEG